MKFVFASIVLLYLSAVAFANVTLPKIFNDNMVLQRDKKIVVWGWAEPKEKITVMLKEQVKSVKAGKDGKWKIELKPETAGGPYTLTIKGNNTLVLNDVMVGDVWICSGQSNMEMQVAANWGYVNNYEQEVAAANYPNIRHFTVPRKVASQPKDDLSDGEWQVCTPANAGGFSAVAYFFARELNTQLDIPIGLINTSWGGTQVESWTSRSAFENSDEFKNMISKMPNVDLDKLVKEKEAALKARLEKLQIWNANPAEVMSWKNSNYNDAGWRTLTVPGLWEQQEPGDIDGVIWVRKAFEIAAEDAGKAATLELSMIDDNEETYINGEKVGATAGYNIKRKYNIPGTVLKAGKNIIAVRIDDTGGGGGIYGDAADVKLTIGTKLISLAGEWKYKVEKVSTGASAIGPNSYPTILFNSMINPLLPMAIKGAIWYQGETNAGRAVQYRKAFPLMINDWRKQWKQGDFPFYFVQLATYEADNGNSEKGSTWAELREAQAMTLSLPNTGMAVTTDIGEVKDIHPKNKQDVGKRLAAIALNKTYGINNVYSGPVYQSLKTDGNKAIVSFTNMGGGLMVKDKYGYIRGFEIAGADQRFYYARAMIQGDKVVVFADSVPNPVAVRYGWADDASDDNLFNKEGFPAGPFRTDNWKAITADVKFKISE